MKSMWDVNVLAPLQKLKVLIIDDASSMRKIIRSMLSTIGIVDVYEASDGADGLAVAELQLPNIILVDWDMPRVNGIEFVRMIRDPRHDLCEVPIIMLTAHCEHWRVVEAAD